MTLAVALGAAVIATAHYRSNMNRMPALALVSGLTAAAIALVLSGCSTTGITRAPARLGASFTHIHEVVVGDQDGSLLVATHEGLYQLQVEAEGSAALGGPVGGLDFDLMGFTIAADSAYASGHPGPATPASFGGPNLGLVTSADLGQTWRSVSRKGETDFHALAVMTAVDGVPHVFGLDPGAPRLQRSTDGGLTWSGGADLVARDILVVDTTVYATTSEGVAVSVDDGMSFTLDSGAPALFLIAADHQNGFAGVDTTGTVWTRSPGRDWVAGGTVTGTPQALAVDGASIYVADDRGIAVTEDGGATWIVLEVNG